MTQTYWHFRRNNFASTQPNVIKLSLEVREAYNFPTHYLMHRWRHQKKFYDKSLVYFETNLVEDQKTEARPPMKS